jgi:hypothetical protein
MRGYRRWIDAPLRGELADEAADPRQKLHASLALLPVDVGGIVKSCVRRILRRRASPGFRR